MSKKKYIPNKKYNPVVMSKKIEKLGEELDRLGKAIEAISKSHDNHISYLGNFARHDIKNAILSMDSILDTTSIEEFNEENIKSLSIYLKVIRDTMDNFVKLVPFSSNKKFTIQKLLVAVELLTRADMQNNNIELSLSYDRNSEIEISLPFQAILQMINNLIINSIKALEVNTIKKIIVIKAEIKAKELYISISDNGNEIKEKEKIFEYGYTTTSGSGIGLFHAKYLCEKLNGDINLLETSENNMSKTFQILLPL